MTGPLAGRHVLFVISSLGAGGAERVIAQLASHLVRSGARASIVSFDLPSDVIYHDFPDATEFHRLGSGSPKQSAFRATGRIPALRRTIKRLRPDIVISFLTKINVITLAATIGMSVPVIVSERNNAIRQPMHPFWKKGVELLFKRASAIVLQTEASAIMLPSSVRSKTVVIGNPISRFPWRSPGIAAKRITAVGRLTEQKGFDTLIDAFARVARCYPDWTLDIWGDGADRPALTARIEERGLTGRARLLGLSKSPGQWIESASIFVLSSRYEGFPNVLGEAMAAGMPVIATNCAFGPADMVQDGDNGVLIPSDDPDAMARAMMRLIADPAQCERLAGRAARIGDSFALPIIAGRWQAVIERCLTQEVAAPAVSDHGKRNARVGAQ